MQNYRITAGFFEAASGELSTVLPGTYSQTCQASGVGCTF